MDLQKRIDELKRRARRLMKHAVVAPPSLIDIINSAGAKFKKIDCSKPFSDIIAEADLLSHETKNLPSGEQNEALARILRSEGRYILRHSPEAALNLYYESFKLFPDKEEFEKVLEIAIAQKSKLFPELKALYEHCFSEVTIEKNLEAIIQKNKSFRREATRMAAGVVSLYLADFCASIMQSSFIKGKDGFDLGLIGDTPRMKISVRSLVDISGLFLFWSIKNQYSYFKDSLNKCKLKEYFTKHLKLIPYDLLAGALSIIPSFNFSVAFMSDMKPVGFGNTQFDYVFRTALLSPMIYAFYNIGVGVLTLVGQPWKLMENVDVMTLSTSIQSLCDKYGLRNFHLMSISHFRTRAFDSQRIMYDAIMSIDAEDSFLSDFHRYLDRMHHPEMNHAKYRMKDVKNDFSNLLTRACFSFALREFDSAKVYTEAVMQIYTNVDLEIFLAKILELNGESDKAAEKWKEIMRKNKKFIINFSTDSKNSVAYMSSAIGNVALAIKNYKTIESAEREAEINKVLGKKLRNQKNFGISKHLATITYEQEGRTNYANIFCVVKGISFESTIMDEKILKKSIDYLAWLNVNLPITLANQSSDNGLWDSIESRITQILDPGLSENLRISASPLIKNLRASQKVFKIDHNPRNTMRADNKIYRLDTEASRLTPLALGLCDALYMMDVDDNLRKKMINYFADRYNHHLESLRRSREQINQGLKMIEDKRRFRLQVLSGVIIRTLELFQPIYDRPRSHYIIEGLFERSRECVDMICREYAGHYEHYRKQYETLRSNIDSLQELMAVNSN